MPDMTPPKAPVNVHRQEATGDKTTTPNPEHVHGLIDSLKGLLGLQGKEPTEGVSQATGKRQTVDEAVDEAVNGVPGKTADY